jgi:hypothetical protein
MHWCRENIDPSEASSHRQLDARGVMVNDSFKFRFDDAPCGGCELEEMAQSKITCFNLRVYLKYVNTLEE